MAIPTTTPKTTVTTLDPDPQQVYRCFHCSGIGEVPVHYPDDKGGVYCNWQCCRHCNGTGKWTEPKDGAA